MAGKPGMKATKPKRLEMRRFKRSFLQTIDGRSKYALVLKARLSQVMTDLGGADQLTYIQRSLCERVIFYEAMLIEMETNWAQGAPADRLHTQTLQTLTNVYKVLGLQRRTRDIAPLRERLGQVVAQQ